MTGALCHGDANRVERPKRSAARRQGDGLATYVSRLVLSVKPAQPYWMKFAMVRLMTRCGSLSSTEKSAIHRSG